MRSAGAATHEDWMARFEQLSGRRNALTPDELDELGLAAWLVGREHDSEQAWADAQQAYLTHGDTDAAMRCVFWLGLSLWEGGNPVKGAAWMSRLFELHAEHPSPRSDAIVAVCGASRAYAEGRIEDSIAQGEVALRLAHETGDTEFEVLATMGLGRSLVHSGRLAEGFARMDAVMLAITTGTASDRVAGPAFCAVIASCMERWDVERAQVWIRDLNDWCDASADSGRSEETARSTAPPSCG